MVVLKKTEKGPLRLMAELLFFLCLALAVAAVLIQIGIHKGRNLERKERVEAIEKEPGIPAYQRAEARWKI